LKGAGLLVHGGGLTQVINASLAGMVEESRAGPNIQQAQPLHGFRDRQPNELAESRENVDLLDELRGRLAGFDSRACHNVRNA